jgi:hypothetical protein
VCSGVHSRLPHNDADDSSIDRWLPAAGDFSMVNVGLGEPRPAGACAIALLHAIACDKIGGRRPVRLGEGQRFGPLNSATHGKR